MTFQDMQNMVLFRLRQRGQAFGGPTSNGATDYDPPYLVKLALNTAYNEFLSRTKEVMAAPLLVASTTVANAVRLALNPVAPASSASGAQNLALATLVYPGTTPFQYANPFAMHVHEFVYVQAGSATQVGQQRYIPIVSAGSFRAFTAGYLGRQGTVSTFPRRVSLMMNEKSLELYPGFATASDTIILTITPDPQATDAYYKSQGTYPCAWGGIMTNDADVPLIDAQFHMALVEHAIANLAPAADKMGQTQLSMQRFETKVQECIDALMTLGEGESEQRVEDPYAATEIGL